mgnify:CR=1 FL=1
MNLEIDILETVIHIQGREKGKERIIGKTEASLSANGTQTRDQAWANNLIKTGLREWEITSMI